MPKAGPIKKTLRDLLGLAAMTLGFLLFVGVAGLVVSPFTGWEWIPKGVLAQMPGVPEPEPEADPIEPLTSLKFAPIPEPPNLGEFVKDRDAAVMLGKALFWDMQVGSDGVQSCASCHFAAGADQRSINQLSPGILGGDSTFNTSGANFQLTVADFPFHKLADPNARFSTVLSDSNDVTSSMGVHLTRFVDIVPGSAVDLGEPQSDPIWNVDGTTVRRVEPRNTPTMINAVFNFDNFWDGRARNIFNGVDPFGELNPEARVLRKMADHTQIARVQVSLINSSLASQAVGPPLSGFEMSFGGRTFPKLGKKMLSLVPLGKQQVHLEDSVLGPLALADKGLDISYADMIKAAFQPQWWDSAVLVDGDLNEVGAGIPANTDQFTMMEANFSLFWGLAVQMYEATLIADDTPFDRFMEGDEDAMTDQQKRGLGLFDSGKTNCSACHQGPEFTNASVSHVENEILELMNMAEGPVAVYDNGFYNIGVRPTGEDVGRGGSAPSGFPLSHSLLAQQGLFVDTSPEGVPEVPPDHRVAVDGAIKVPGLRNVELTAPYFHNGGQLTLRQVVEFYNRGGDFHEQNIANLAPDIQNLSLSEQDKTELVAFLTALTDERVRFQKAPFDHPQLFVPNGHLTAIGAQAEDNLLEIPAVGRDGSNPIPKFLAVSESQLVQGQLVPGEDLSSSGPSEGSSEESSGSSGGSPPVTCSAPGGLQGTLDISWVTHPSPDVVGYNLYRSLTSGGPYEKVNTDPVTDTTFRNSGLDSGTTYFYVITAIDLFGNESPKSVEVSGTTNP